LRRKKSLKKERVQWNGKSMSRKKEEMWSQIQEVGILTVLCIQEQNSFIFGHILRENMVISHK